MRQIEGNIVEVKKLWGRNVKITIEAPIINSPNDKDRFIVIEVSPLVATVMSNASGYEIGSSFYHIVKKGLLGKNVAIVVK